VHGARSLGIIARLYCFNAQLAFPIVIDAKQIACEDPHRVNTITHRSADLAHTQAGSIPAELTIRFGSHQEPRSCRFTNRRPSTPPSPAAASAPGQWASICGPDRREYSDASGIHGFLLSGGTYTALKDLSAPNFTEAFGINSAGQIVGEYVPGGGFLLSGGTYTTLNRPGSVSTIVEEINSRRRASRDGG
jgi:hypothetical protein